MLPNVCKSQNRLLPIQSVRYHLIDSVSEATQGIVNGPFVSAGDNTIVGQTGRNFSPLMCMAAKTTIVQTRKLVARGDIEPEHVITPGIFVDRIVEVSHPVHEDTLIAEGRSYP